MKLYRGDSIPRKILSTQPASRGRTFAKHFCDNGLMAKFADGGQPILLAGKDLRQLVEEHVGYTRGSQAEKLSRRSPMLSFSSSNKCAFGYSERRNRRRIRLENCDFLDATHFVWELRIDLPKPSRPGLYEFQYFFDPKHCQEIVDLQVQKAHKIWDSTGNFDPLATALAPQIVIREGLSDKSTHLACLIDVKEFLKEDREASNPEILALARQRAIRDKEWLLYPSDTMPNGQGLSARFVMNKDLKVFTHYR